MPERRTILKAGGVLGVAGALGLGALHSRPRLYDVRIANYRAESVRVDVRLDTDGETALRSTFDLRPSEQTHLPCEWPRAAWSYRMAVRPAGADEWETITWDGGGKLCKKVVINAEDASVGPVSFFYSRNCPWPFEDNSCGPGDATDA